VNIVDYSKAWNNRISRDAGFWKNNLMIGVRTDGVSGFHAGKKYNISAGMLAVIKLINSKTLAACLCICLFICVCVGVSFSYTHAHT